MNIAKEKYLNDFKWIYDKLFEDIKAEIYIEYEDKIKKLKDKNRENIDYILELKDTMYELEEEKIVDLEEEVLDLKAEVERLKSHNKILRENLLKKIEVNKVKKVVDKNVDFLESKTLNAQNFYERIEKETFEVKDKDSKNKKLESNLKEQSELKLLGYSTSLGRDERRRILIKVAIPQMGKAAVIKHLKWLIKMNIKRKSMENAVHIWKGDLKTITEQI